jgi:hypothetical protein
MNDDTRSRIEAIRARIAENSDMDPGSPLSEEQLLAFEQENGITLPIEYRLFLQIVGDGIFGDNIYGIYYLSELPPVDDWTRGDLSKPFRLTGSRDFEADGYPAERDDEDWTYENDGRLYVCSVGCGQFWILIVTGPERGNMWLTCEFGYFPSVPRIGFLEWCELWVEQGWNDGLEDLIVDEEVEE